MTIEKLFFIYMAAAGLAAGALLVTVPQTQDFWLRPYFWLLIAVLAFDLGVMLMRRNAPGPMLAMNARLIGFVIGVVLMVAMPMIAGVTVRYF